MQNRANPQNPIIGLVKHGWHKTQKFFSNMFLFSSENLHKKSPEARPYNTSLGALHAQNMDSNQAREKPYVSLVPNAKFPDPHLIIVGAGPVGWDLGLLLKTSLPDLKILFLERYEDYIRTHSVRIQLNTLKDLEIRNRILALPNVKVKKNLVFVPVQALEKLFSTYGKEVDIAIDFQKFTHREQISEAYPNCKIIFGADGRHSSVRKNVFGPDDKMLTEYPMQGLLQVKFVLPGNQETKLSNLKKLKAQVRTRHLFEEFVEYNAEKNETRVSGTFFVDADTFKKLPESKEKKPLEDFSDLPAHLKAAISIWLKDRHTQEINTLTITKIELEAYHSKSYYVKDSDRIWLLVGDAALGVPYFRSLNAGLECCEQIVGLLTEHFKTHGLGAALDDVFLRRYHQIMRNKFNHEFVNASIKDASIDIAQSSIFSSAAVSYPAAKLSQMVHLKKYDVLHPIFTK